MAETLFSPGILMRENDISFLAPAPLETGAAILGPTVKGPVEVPTQVTSYGQFQRIFGTTFESSSNSHEFLTSIAVKAYFEQGGPSVLVTRIVTGSFQAATSTKVIPASGSTGSFTLATLGQGTIFNNATGALDPGLLNSDGSLKSGSADNLRWEIAGVNNSKGTFSMVIRQGSDSTKNRVILETFTDLSLDPNSENYIEKVIGNQRKFLTVDSDGSRYISVEGNFVNRSNYVRVASVDRPTLNYLSTDGTTVNRDSTGSSYSGSLPSIQSGSFYGATGTVSIGAFNGTSGSITATDTQGLTGGCYANAISILGNTDEYGFNMISAPGLLYGLGAHKTQLDSLISLVETRGDCIAVVDMGGVGSSVSEIVGTAQTLNSSYAATYWPWLQMQSATGRNIWVPASVVMPGVFAFTDRVSAPWFAPAGLTRGGIPSVIQAERKLTRVQRDTLYGSNVNPIGTFPGAGIAAYGQKTLQKKASALDRVSVRRLLIELKKFIGDVSRTLVFEQNSISTRDLFLSKVTPYLESVVQRQGLYAFKVVMDDNLNTADVIDRNQLLGQVYIQPSKTVEYIILDFTITPTGAAFGS